MKTQSEKELLSFINNSFSKTDYCLKVDPILNNYTVHHKKSNRMVYQNINELETALMLMATTMQIRLNKTMLYKHKLEAMGIDPDSDDLSL